MAIYGHVKNAEFLTSCANTVWSVIRPDYYLCFLLAVHKACEALELLQQSHWGLYVFRDCLSDACFSIHHDLVRGQYRTRAQILGDVHGIINSIGSSRG